MAERAKKSVKRRPAGKPKEEKPHVLAIEAPPEASLEVFASATRTTDEESFTGEAFELLLVCGDRAERRFFQGEADYRDCERGVAFAFGIAGVKYVSPALPEKTEVLAELPPEKRKGAWRQIRRAIRAIKSVRR